MIALQLQTCMQLGYALAQLQRTEWAHGHGTSIVLDADGRSFVVLSELTGRSISLLSAH